MILTINMIFPGLIILLLIFVLIRINVKRNLSNKKKAQLAKLNKDEKFFLCNSFEDLGEGLFQLYGEAVNGSIRPGMKIEISDKEYKIKEVYATGSKPDPEIVPGIANCAIVIEKEQSDSTSININLKTRSDLKVK